MLRVEEGKATKGLLLEVPQPAADLAEALDEKPEHAGRDHLSWRMRCRGEEVGVEGSKSLFHATRNKEFQGIWVGYVYFLPRYRNNSIGTQAVRMAVSCWRQTGYMRVSLDYVHKTQDFWGKLRFPGEGKRKSLEIKDAQEVART